MIIPYQEIKRLCERDKLVEPAVERSKAFGMTFGLGPAGYDVRVSESLVVPSRGFSLAGTMEKFNIPTYLVPNVLDKSTWARRGLQAFNTTLEPGWRGYLTLELVNHSDEPIFILAGMPIVQIQFIMMTEPTELPYAGKYQDQPMGAVKAILEK